MAGGAAGGCDMGAGGGGADCGCTCGGSCFGWGVGAVFITGLVVWKMDEALGSPLGVVEKRPLGWG